MTAPHDRDPERDPQPGRDDDAVFRQIVAGFADQPSDAVPRWPVSEDVDESASETDVEELVATPREAGDGELPAWLEPAALPDEGHYVPPPPPRLPRLRPRTLSALALMLLGFAVLFIPFRIGLDDSTGSMLLGMALVAGGATLLIGSMRDAPAPDDRPDDGAVV
ncbi:MAG: hypothetical protein M3P04_09440 [Actinomycetota bacterium]|nr:hypothetical protein [Actinomycetota bacterium]